MKESHYLKEELYALISGTPAIFEFLQNGSLDGLWYWDLENPENEWLNARFWELLGYDAKEKKHLAKEWQDLINPDDLKLAIENLHKHCADPSHPYDQIVRYRHKKWQNDLGPLSWNVVPVHRTYSCSYGVIYPLISIPGIRIIAIQYVFRTHLPFLLISPMWEFHLSLVQ